MLGLLLFLFSTELLVRIFLQPPRQLIAAHSQFGWSYLPNATFSVAQSESTMNAAGFRDKDHQPGPASKKFRILLLGDSYLAAISHPEEEIFARRLEKQLRASELPKILGKEIEVLNSGVSAWSTDQQLRYFELEGSRYQPDLTILLAVPNDVRESFAKKIYLRGSSGSLQLHDIPRHISFSDRAKWWLLNRSACVQWLGRKFSFNDVFSIVQKYYPFTFSVEGRKASDLDIFAKNPAPEMAEAYQLFESLVTELAKQARNSKTDLVLTAIPTRAEYEYPLAVSPHHLPGRFSHSVQLLSKKLGLPHIDLKGNMPDRAKVAALYIQEEYHFNAEGHQSVANQLEKFLIPYIKGRFP